ncbi:hypothetical protein BC832DRAFT_564690 [Gaertneriomyces semiglobifer]|nr:hypothetical protein BC832DRAFT_564690 [Gaertneriomyces semiglobifer]
MATADKYITHNYTMGTFDNHNTKASPGSSVQPFLIATLIICVPVLGFLRRFLDRVVPKNDLDARKRPRAVAMLLYGVLRTIMLCIDLSNAPEFFSNWFTPMNISERFHQRNLYTCGIYSSMIVFDMASFELNGLGFIHHTVALAGMSLSMIGMDLPIIYHYYVYLYRAATLWATPTAFVLAYYYLGDNKYESLTKKHKMLKYGLWQFRVALNSANIIGLAYYFTHFHNLTTTLRVLIILIQCGFVPEQIFTAKQIAQWQKRLMTQVKAVASPVSPIAMELARRISAVAQPMAEMTRRLSVSDVKRRLSVSLSISEFRKRMNSISSPRSPTSSVSPTSPSSPMSPMLPPVLERAPINTKFQLPSISESRQVSPIERARPMRAQPYKLDTRVSRRRPTGDRAPISAPY